MRLQTRVLLLASFVGATAVGTPIAANAQYYYPPPPYGYGYGPGVRTWNGCPPGYTVQGGVCQPYRGPVGGGWRTWNGCPPGYTVQGGNCAPYQGPVGSPPADGMAIEFKRTQARRYLLGSLVSRLLGRPHARPEFCRENFVLRTRF
jgi:hypothetical protein